MASHIGVSRRSGASWLAIVALGVVVGSSLLRTIVVTHVDGVSAQLVLRRWNPLDRVALGAAVLGAGLRLLMRPQNVTTGHGFVLVLAGVALSIVLGTRRGRVALGAASDRRRQIQALAGGATLGLVGVAWGDVCIRGGATVDVVVRTLHR